MYRLRLRVRRHTPALTGAAPLSRRPLLGEREKGWWRWGGRRCLCETSIHMRSTLLAAISICTCDLSKSVKGEES